MSNSLRKSVPVIDAAKLDFVRVLLKHEKLEIYLLAQNGAVERRIRCFAGRVSVLREAAPGELDKYTAALGGQAQAERFSILVDEKGYDPKEHLLIGFSEVLASETRSVGEYLTTAGVPAFDIERLLLKSGLGGTSNRSCASLNEIESRSVLLLAATYADDGKVIVLNDPFKYFSPAWVEFHAERVSDFALRARAIVVVVNLSVRPECWIENELIARIQVGGVRRRTIGFGSSSPEMNELLAQVRADSEQLAQPNPTPSKEASDITTYQPLKPFHDLTAASARPKSRSRLFGNSPIPIYLLSGTVAAGITLLLLWDSAPSNQPSLNHPLTSQPQTGEIALASNDTANKNGAVKDQPSPPTRSIEPVEKADRTLVKVPKESDSIKPESEVRADTGKLHSDQAAHSPNWPVLKGYPAMIQQQIMLAYDPTSSAIRPSRAAPGGVNKNIRKPAQAKVPADHVSIFTELSQVAKDTNESSKPNPFLTNPANSEQAADFARRREEILKRFLEER